MKKILSFDSLYIFLFVALIGFSFNYLQHHIPTQSIETYKENLGIKYLLLFGFALAFFPVVELVYGLRRLPLYRIVFIASFTFLLFSTALSYRLSIDCSVLFFICGFICLLVEKKIYKPTLFSLSLLLYFLFNLLSYKWVEPSTINYKVIRIYFPFLYFAFAFLFVRFNANEIEHIIRAFYRFMFLFVIYTIITWRHEMLFLHISVKQWLIERPQYFTDKVITPYNIIFRWSYYPHPTYNGVCALFALFFAIHLGSKSKNISKILTIIIFTISILFLTIISQSRTTGVGLIAVILLGTGLYCIKTRNYKLVYFATTILLSAITIYTFRDKTKNFIKDPERVHEYAVAIYSIKQKPMWGTGLGAIRNVLDSKEISNALGYSEGLPDRGNPHNQFLGDLMQTGVIGLVLVLLLFGILYYYALKDRNKLLLLFLVVYSLLALIEMPLNIHKGVILFLPFSLMLIQFRREQKNIST